MSSSSSTRAHAFLHQVAGLAHDRALQPVGDEALDLLLQHARHLAQRLVEGDGVGGGGRVGALAGNDLDQRDQVRRVERMPDQQPARILHQAALFAGRARRARRQQQRVARHGRLDACPQRLLPLGLLGAVLLHQIGTGDGALEIGLEAQVALEPFVRQAECLQRRRDLRQRRLHRALDVGLRIVDDHVQPVREEQRRPRRADDAGADDADVAVAAEHGRLFFRRWHGFGLSRASESARRGEAVGPARAGGRADRCGRLLQDVLRFHGLSPVFYVPQLAARVGGRPLRRHRLMVAQTGPGRKVHPYRERGDFGTVRMARPRRAVIVARDTAWARWRLRGPRRRRSAWPRRSAAHRGRSNPPSPAPGRTRAGAACRARRA